MDQLSLFDFVGEDAMDSVGSKLQVVKAKFIGTESTDWVELFDGFDELYAITFSSGIDFTCKVVKKFKYAEIIFGCEDLAKIHNYNVEQQFSVVGIIYGDSNGGKSTFVKLLSKMMSNAKIKQNSSGDFTGSVIKLNIYK